ncbi:MAG: hypothetical protein IJN27_01780 [Oscillospiraceae bacterium]|nr:hypothetical protein [Oscillospiraceae bacterium]
MDKVFSNAIVKYGIEKQSFVAVEELSELQKEICKAQRGKFNKDNMTEELADVWVMCEQVKMMYGITDDQVMRKVHDKVARLKMTLAEG